MPLLFDAALKLINLDATTRAHHPADHAAPRGRLSIDSRSSGDKIGRTLVKLRSKRLVRKIELEDLLQNLDLSVPEPPANAAPGKKLAVEKSPEYLHLTAPNHKGSMRSSGRCC